MILQSPVHFNHNHKKKAVWFILLKKQCKFFLKTDSDCILK